MMRFIAMMVAALLAFGLSACGSQTDTAAKNAAAISGNTSSEEDSQQAAPDEGTQQADVQESADYTAQREEEKQVCAKFIEAYDKRPGVTPITPGDAFDPQAGGGLLMKADGFTDELYKGSYGSQWTSGDLVGDMVAFKSTEGIYGIMVAAYGPKQNINGFYRDAITVLDPTVDQNNLSAAIMDASLYGGDGKVEGCDLPVMSYSIHDGNALVIAGSANFSQTDVSAASPQKQDENADLTEGHALVALEDYGKQVFPYGFKLHTFLGMQVDKHPSPNVWEFQVTCDVTNEYGATAKDQVCNATVTLIGGVWQVTDFSVH